MMKKVKDILVTVFKIGKKIFKGKDYDFKKKDIADWTDKDINDKIKSQIFSWWFFPFFIFSPSLFIWLFGTLLVLTMPKGGKVIGLFDFYWDIFSDWDSLSIFLIVASITSTIGVLMALASKFQYKENVEKAIIVKSHRKHLDEQKKGGDIK